MRTVAALAAFSLTTGSALAAPPAPVDPTVAPEPGVLIAQAGIDALDADLADEKTLADLQQDEYDAEAWSMGAAVGLSMLPGAGWGLIYTDKSAQSTVPFLLSIVGYSIGGLYMAGLFDEESEDICQHVRDGRVGFAECGYSEVAPDITLEPRVDSQDVDTRDPAGRYYFQTASDYEVVTRGEDFDGFKTGLVIIGSTYVLTTLIGAVWSGATVYDHNDQLRKDIEATAGRSTVAEVPVRARPVIAYTGERGLFGVALDF